MIDNIIQYFDSISSAHRSIILIGGLTFFFTLENILPFFTTSYKKWKHAGLNVFFTLTTVVVNFVLAFSLVWTSDYVVTHGIGILQWITVPTWFTLVLGLLLLDFLGAWLAHWVQHHVSWMWRFHLIHHSDQHLDSTSGNRHHPGESVIRFGFTLLATVIVGAPMWLVFLYQSMSAFMTQFNHANINLHKGVDKALSLVICTPGMHRVHHHYRQPYSDMNYGNIFSFWDRIFRTYIEVDNKKIVYGLDTHMDAQEVNHIPTLLKLPFQKYRHQIKYDNKEVL